MAHIFISYSTKDAAYAYRLADDLQARGFNVWIDNAKLRSSENWWESIVRALRAADAVIVIMSPHSRASRWVQREVTPADNWEKPTFPLLLDGENFEIFVLTQYADVTDNNLPNQQWYERLAIESPPDITAGTRVTQDTVPIKDDSLIREAVANPPEADEIVQSPAPIIRKGDFTLNPARFTRMR
ncbi:MAG: toll/interleukin-1 receptor domain-containing protein [Chloroflexota bacterium]